MTNEEYSALALRTAPRSDASSIDDAQARLLLGALGLVGEAGEVAEMIKKHVFHGHRLDVPKLIKELGDVLWYLNMLQDFEGYTLEMVMQANIDKLAARYPEGFFSSERSINRAAGDE